MLRLLFSSALMAITLASAPVKAEDTAVAIFAGGCFWCVESDFDHISGVKETISGYIGGKDDNPTYKNHSANGDREAVRITFDPSVIGYDALLKTFFRSIDPTDDGGQFCDRGHSYTTAVYTLDDMQADLANAARTEAEEHLKAPVVTEILSAATFWPAEEYHQNFHAKNPIRYNYYRFGCGRDNRIKAVWGDDAHHGVNES